MEHTLPGDLMPEIHLKLPVRSLVRFKRVDKSWYNQISSRYFVGMNEKHAKKNPRFLVHSHYCQHQDDDGKSFGTSWRSFNIKTLSETSSFVTKCQVYEVLVSCLGLICFLGSKDGKQGQIFLCNPSSSQVLALPLDSSTKSAETPIKGFGIGYLAPSQKYKLVMLFNRRNDRGKFMKCEVMEVSNGGDEDGDGKGEADGDRRNFSDWRLVDDCPDFVKDCTIPTVVEDKIYWKTNDKNSVLSFNIKNEKFGTLNYPNPEQSVVFGRMYLMDLEGKLGVAMAFSINACFTIKIWKLQAENSGRCVWENKYAVPLPGITGMQLVNLRTVYVLDKEIIMYSGYILLIYNTESKTRRKLFVPRGTWPAGMYHGSLFSLGTI